MEIPENVHDMLSELINTGVGRAAASLNELVELEIDLSLPVIHVLNWQEMSAYCKRGELKRYVAVSQAFCGLLTGRGIVTFPVVDGRTLVNLLLEAGTGTDEPLDVIELEAISEVGNVMINALQGTISDMANVEVEYSLPEVNIVDDLHQYLKKSGNDVYMVGEVIFNITEIEVEGLIVMIYAYENIQTLSRIFFEETIKK